MVLVIKRVEELPQYKGTIKQRERSHISKKIVGMALGLVVALLSGCIIHLALAI